jgi:hypothetical protein
MVAPTDRNVNFAFFEGLTDEQAEECLHEFLREGEDALPVLIAEALADGIAAHLSVESVPRMIGVVERRVTTQALDPDPDIPAWIRESETYEENLFDFSDESKRLLAAAAFYFGEAFVGGYPNLRWGVGDRRTAVQAQPVVDGFSHGLELAVLLVTENVVARGVHDGSSEREAERAVASWRAHIAP